MVVSSAPSACTVNRVQLLTGSPLKWMTQAPHWLVSQPTCVPVSPRLSRRKLTSSRRGSTSAAYSTPLTFIRTATLAGAVMVVAMVSLLLRSLAAVAPTPAYRSRWHHLPLVLAAEREPTDPKVGRVWSLKVDASARNRRHASTRAGIPPAVGLADHVSASIPLCVVSRKSSVGESSFRIWGVRHSPPTSQNSQPAYDLRLTTYACQAMTVLPVIE